MPLLLLLPTKGIPAVLPDGLYAEFIQKIANEGSLRCTITGRLAQIPADFDPLYRDLVGIPQLYILVEHLEPSRAATDSPFLSTGAIMIETKAELRPPEHKWDMADGVFAAFVSFFPGAPNAIKAAAEWLEDIYVHGLLDGQVLTNFDEQFPRFEGATFGLEEVMGGRISTTDAKRLLRRCAASEDEIRELIEKVEKMNGDSWTIIGDGNVVATHGGAAANHGAAAAAGTSAAATHRASAAAGHSSTEAGFVQRAGESRWAKSFGVITLIATVAATILLILNVTNVGIAGYIVAVIAVLVGIIPLFKK